MDYLIKKYKERCKKEFFKFGFKLYKNNFYRVINDVFQSFCLHKSSSGSECTVEFIIVPLCIGDIIKKTYCGSNHLKMFENEYSWFLYDKNDEKSIDTCINEIIEYMKKYLIPHFENANNSKNAYYEICNFQQMYYKSGIFFADYSLFYMSLKSELYDKSIAHLIAIKNHTQIALQRNKECFGNQLNVEYEKKIMDKIKKIDYQINMISEFDLEYIEKLIDENEKCALLNLGISEGV